MCSWNWTEHSDEQVVAMATDGQLYTTPCHVAVTHAWVLLIHCRTSEGPISLIFSLGCTSLMLDDTSLSSSPGLGCQSLMLGSPHPLQSSSSLPWLSSLSLPLKTGVSSVLSGSVHAFSGCNESVLRRSMVSDQLCKLLTIHVVTLIEAPQLISLAPRRVFLSNCSWVTKQGRRSYHDNIFIHKNSAVHHASVGLAQAGPNHLQHTLIEALEGH